MNEEDHNKTGLLASLLLKLTIGWYLLFPFSAATSSPLPKHFNSIAVAARDSDTGDFGVAIVCNGLGAGPLSTFAEAEVGAVVTFGFINPSLGNSVLHNIKKGLDPKTAIQQGLNALPERDPEGRTREGYIVGAVDAKGRSATYTGQDMTDAVWAGGTSHDNFSVIGTHLPHAAILEKAIQTFQRSEGSLADRLLTVLEIVPRLQGDRSAAILIVRTRGGELGTSDHMMDLRVDDHPSPLQELKRLRSIWNSYSGIDCHLRAAHTWKQAGRTSLADRERAIGLTLVESMLRVHKTNPEKLVEAAYYLCQYEVDPARAIQLAKQAVVLSSRKNADFLDTLALCLYKAGHQAEAINISKEALRLQPHSTFFQKQLERFSQPLDPTP